ncbi:hypothetical protein BN131_1462 [Cronobacter malonaticus 681]|nr:hypothetical protein BN131_1462 [Cronobacter malonaticus 681]
MPVAVLIHGGGFGQRPKTQRHRLPRLAGALQQQAARRVHGVEHRRHARGVHRQQRPGGVQRNVTGSSVGITRSVGKRRGHRVSAVRQPIQRALRYGDAPRAIRANHGVIGFTVKGNGHLTPRLGRAGGAIQHQRLAGFGGVNHVIARHGANGHVWRNGIHCHRYVGGGRRAAIGRGNDGVIPLVGELRGGHIQRPAAIRLHGRRADGSAVDLYRDFRNAAQRGAGNRHRIAQLARFNDVIARHRINGDGNGRRRSVDIHGYHRARRHVARFIRHRRGKLFGAVGKCRQLRRRKLKRPGIAVLHRGSKGLARQRHRDGLPRFDVRDRTGDGLGLLALRPAQAITTKRRVNGKCGRGKRHIERRGGGGGVARAVHQAHVHRLQAVRHVCPVSSRQVQRPGIAGDRYAVRPEGLITDGHGDLAARREIACQRAANGAGSARLGDIHITVAKQRLGQRHLRRGQRGLERYINGLAVAEIILRHDGQRMFARRQPGERARRQRQRPVTCAVHIRHVGGAVHVDSDRHILVVTRNAGGARERQWPVGLADVQYGIVAKQRGRGRRRQLGLDLERTWSGVSIAVSIADVNIEVLRAARREARKRGRQQRDGPVAVGLHRTGVGVTVEHNLHRLASAADAGATGNRLGDARFGVIERAVDKRRVDGGVRHIVNTRFKAGGAGIGVARRIGDDHRDRDSAIRQRLELRRGERQRPVTVSIDGGLYHRAIIKAHHHSTDAIGRQAGRSVERSACGGFTSIKNAIGKRFRDHRRRERIGVDAEGGVRAGGRVARPVGHRHRNRVIAFGQRAELRGRERYRPVTVVIDGAGNLLAAVNGDEHRLACAGQPGITGDLLPERGFALVDCPVAKELIRHGRGRRCAQHIHRHPRRRRVAVLILRGDGQRVLAVLQCVQRVGARGNLPRAACAHCAVKRNATNRDRNRRALRKPG